MSVAPQAQTSEYRSIYQNPGACRVIDLGSSLLFGLRSGMLVLPWGKIFFVTIVLAAFSERQTFVMDNCPNLALEGWKNNPINFCADA